MMAELNQLNNVRGLPQTAMIMAMPTFWIELLLLLIPGPFRLQLRAACSGTNAAGNAILAKFRGNDGDFTYHREFC